MRAFLARFFMWSGPYAAGAVITDARFGPLDWEWFAIILAGSLVFFGGYDLAQSVEREQ